MTHDQTPRDIYDQNPEIVAEFINDLMDQAELADVPPSGDEIDKSFGKFLALLATTESTPNNGARDFSTDVLIAEVQAQHALERATREADRLVQAAGEVRTQAELYLDAAVARAGDIVSDALRQAEELTRTVHQRAAEMTDRFETTRILLDWILEYSVLKEQRESFPAMESSDGRARGRHSKVDSLHDLAARIRAGDIDVDELKEILRALGAACSHIDVAPSFHVTVTDAEPAHDLCQPRHLTLRNELPAGSPDRAVTSAESRQRARAIAAS